MTLATFEHSPQRDVRRAGIAYLAIILFGLFGEAVVRNDLVVSGDPSATAHAIAGASMLWRAGIVGDLLMHILDLPVIVVLHLLLERVSRPLALFATSINLIQTAVLVANKLNLVVPLLLLDGSAYVHAFSAQQRHALAYLAIEAHGYGFAIGLVFFGIACIVRGCLIVRSGWFPKPLGVLLALAGASYLINSFALLIAPSAAAAMFPAVLVPALVGELSLALWMTVKGVDLSRWRSHA